MFAFKAFFLDDRAYINHTAYRNNEILTSLLNLPQRKLLKLLEELGRHRQRVKLAESDYDLCVRFNEYAHEAQDCLFNCGNLIKTILPYKHLPETSRLDTPLLFQLLNQHYPFWRDSVVELDEMKSPDYVNEFGFSVREDDGVFHFIYDQFHPDFDDLLEPEASVKAAIDSTNQATDELFGEFIRIVQDLIRVRSAYAVFLDQFLNTQNRYLTEAETAKGYTAFLAATKNQSTTSQVVSSGTMKLAYEVYRKPDGTEQLSESYEFDGLGAFLYFDFFRGLSQQYIPHRCHNCGRYFLLLGVRHSSYCDRPLKEDRSKTCRDVGARKKYDDKCRSDPIWLAYNRAYKAHYARYMKKKMTAAEFEQWSRGAIELREQAEADRLDLEEYKKLLRV